MASPDGRLVWREALEARSPGPARSHLLAAARSDCLRRAKVPWRPIARIQLIMHKDHKFCLTHVELTVLGAWASTSELPPTLVRPSDRAVHLHPGIRPTCRVASSAELNSRQRPICETRCNQAWRQAWNHLPHQPASRSIERPFQERQRQPISARNPLRLARSPTQR